MALLGDDVRTALECVDDHGVLLRILHRQLRQMDAASHVQRQVVPGGLRLGEDDRALRVVRDGGDVGTREKEVRLLIGAHVLGERGQHAKGILESVPPRDLRQQRAVEWQLLLLHQPRPALDEAEAAVEALEDGPDVAGGRRRRGAPR